MVKKNKISIFKIVDFIGHEKFFTHYSNVFFKLIKIYAAEYIDFYSYGINEKYILNAGFINRRKHKNLVIPEYFEPFVKKNINLMYGYINNTKKRLRFLKLMAIETGLINFEIIIKMLLRIS